mgnify:CR=1 FL=1
MTTDETTYQRLWYLRYALERYRQPVMTFSERERLTALLPADHPEWVASSIARIDTRIDEEVDTFSSELADELTKLFLSAIQQLDLAKHSQNIEQCWRNLQSEGGLMKLTWTMDHPFSAVGVRLALLIITMIDEDVRQVS